MEMHDEYQGKHEAEPVVGDAPPRANVLLSNNAYDKLKFLAVVVLPALGTLYFGLAEIWGLPKAQEVVGSIVVLDAFIGVVLQISNKQYNNSDARFDGVAAISKGQDEDGNPVTDINLSLDPQSLVSKKEVVVRVDKK